MSKPNTPLHPVPPSPEDVPAEVALLERRTSELATVRAQLREEVRRRHRAEMELVHAHRAVKALSACHAASRHATSEQELLTDCCRIIVETGGYRLAWVGFANDDAAYSVSPVAQFGYEEGYLETLRLSWSEQWDRGRGPTGSAIRTGQAQIVNDIHSNPVYLPWREEAAKRGYASAVALPLVMEGKVLGALNIYAPEQDAFDRDEVALLQELADSVGFGVVAVRDAAERKRVEARDLRTYMSRITLSALLETALESLTLTRQLEVALDIILSVPWLAVESKGSIFLAESGDGQLTLAAQRGLSEDLQHRCRRVSPGHCLCGLAAQSREIIYAGELDSRHGTRYHGIQNHGHYCIPILYQEHLMGVLNLYLAPGYQRDPEEEAFLSTVANTLAGIIRQRRTEQELEQERRFTAAVLNTAPAVILVLTPAGTIVRINRHGEALLGHTSQELAGRPFDEVFPVVAMPRRVVDWMDNKRPGCFETTLRDSSGQTRNMAWNALPMRDEQDEMGYLICSGLDITARKRAEARIQHMAHHDALTGLPNRMLFQERLAQAMAISRRHRTPLAVLFLDLDRFKAVNDTLGHDVGDQLLTQAAQRIRSLLRRADTVARMGGDEFTVVLTEIAHREDAGIVAEKIIELLNRAFYISGHTCHIGASVGISLFPGDGEEPDTLVQKADLAMYEAKQGGRNRFGFFNSGTLPPQQDAPPATG